MRQDALGWTLVLALLTLLPQPDMSAQGCCGQDFHAAEWQVTDADRSIAFYTQVLGLLHPPGWKGQTNPPAQGNGPLTGAEGGYWRVISLPIPGAGWHMQIVETTGIAREPFAARRQDVGAAGLILYVRNLDAAVAALQKAGAPIVTEGGRPVPLGPGGRGRTILATDPDGLFVELRQPDPLPATKAPPDSNILNAAVSVTVGDTEETARYWRDVMGFRVDASAPFRSDRDELRLHGTPGAQVRKSIATVPEGGKFHYPGNDVTIEFLEFRNVDRRARMPRYQDPGSGGFVFRLWTREPATRGKEMADFVRVLKNSPQTRILTTGGEALDQTRRFAIFFQDLNGFILEATQSTPDPRISRDR